MSRDLSAGPAAGAAWISYPAAEEHAPSILAIPDAANPQRAAAGLPALYYGVPAAPQLARDGTGQPVLSLSLLLARRPGPDDDSIFELVDAGALACDLTLALPPGAAGDTLRPLFARQVDMRLEHAQDGTREALAEGQGWGGAARVALGARLDQAAAQGVLKALHGMESGLAVRCRIAYRGAGERCDVRMKIRWAAAHAQLARHLDADGVLAGATVRALLPDLMDAEALQAWRLGPDGAGTPLAPAQADSLWSPFMMFGGLLLERLPPVQAPTGDDARYALRTCPDAGAELDTRTWIDTAQEDVITLCAPLEDLVGKALDGVDAERFIHLTCSDPGAPGGVGEVPRRVLGASRSRAPGAAAQSAVGMARVGGDLVSLTRALEPDRSSRPPPAALLASDGVRVHPGPLHAFAANGIDLPDIDDEDEPALPLPRLDDRNAPLWPDQADPAHFWYAPDYTLAAPDPALSPEAGSFLFTFHEAGHDASGRVVLEGAARFTLRRAPSAATQQALAARAGAHADPVSLTGLSASLSLPLRDAGGQPGRVALPAEVTNQGDSIVVQVPLLNDYVRVAYGDLAYPGFQSEPARLRVVYGFDAMVPMPLAPNVLHFLEKERLTPVAYTAQQEAQLAARPHLDARRMTYRGVGADVQFRRETVAEPVREAALADAGTAPPGMQAARAPVAAARSDAVAASVAQARLAPAIQSRLENSVRLQQLVRRRRYAKQAQGRSIDIDVSFPCATFGAQYRQMRGGVAEAVGCQDSFSLGAAPLKLYEQVADPALASPRYTLYKSCTQPGRYLVLPATYLITRYGPGEGERAWRPAVYLYSTIDPVSADNNRCVLMASLQPDLPPWERHELESRLTLPNRTPEIEYVTALDGEVEYTWALPDGGLKIDVAAARLYDSFQVALTTDATGVRLLQSILTHSGLAGQARFRLADGTLLASTLRLDLNQLTGPWNDGPVEVVLAGARATLTNRIERPVDVGDVILADAGGMLGTVPCERTLGPAETVALDLPFPAARAWAVYTIGLGDPATFAAINSFIENIRTNVVFVRLFEFAAHDLARLSLVARIKEAPGSETPVTLSADQPVAEAAFMLPLTVYLGPHTLQFQVTKTDTAGGVTTTAWLESDLASGSVVSLVWSLIQ